MQELKEKVSGIVERVTYHNPENGWSVLRVSPFNSPATQETVTVHQTKVFAGATMEFFGAWTYHSQFGRQFKAERAVEKKPATSAALEKYLGSGLIKGVGPKTAKKIVHHFESQTLEVFETDISRLTEVEGIARKKLSLIEKAWREHRAIREVMMFLQGHGISTLFAVRIFKQYGEEAIEKVVADPYRLASDFYGIGFFSADKVALSIGLAEDSEQRIVAAIAHVLAASREEGHCFLSREQIADGIKGLLDLELGERLQLLLGKMEDENRLKLRLLPEDGDILHCYYSKSLYYDEAYVAEKLCRMLSVAGRVLTPGVNQWLEKHCKGQEIRLSKEQLEAVKSAVSRNVSILTGGPGCGKTTTTLVIVRMLESLGVKVVLAAPTGRAAQRMSEVIGREAKTLHRLLEWQNGRFLKNEEQPLRADCLIVDECSMLDISLTASLLRAVPDGCQVLFIGDADQLPSVGAGNVLRDLIASGVVPVAKLTEIFRQAKKSKIIQYAHDINSGRTPQIESPFKKPALWEDGEDCLFFDSDESTQEQLSFISRVKRLDGFDLKGREEMSSSEDPLLFRTEEPILSSYEPPFTLPKKFEHVDLAKIVKAEGEIEGLKAVVKKIHPWSTLHFGLTAVQSVVRLYTDWIPKYYGQGTEIQILSPMTRGSLGTLNLNKVIQEAVNPACEGKAQVMIGERILRVGDRIIHKRNNYDLNVFNGDIGRVVDIDTVDLGCLVRFSPDNREVVYKKDDLLELDLAYAITIHKSQGSEFEAVIMPLLTQHFKMLFRNLIYTGLTRAKKLAVGVGTRRALAMAVRQEDSGRRQTALQQLLVRGM
ncbi:SF1B family DNA helicase RecD2 [Desulforhopalus sp. 52FAK]